jgi:hypothetical protein
MTGPSAWSADRPCTTAELFAQFGDVLEEAADQEGGAEVTDHQVFQSHARRFERDFQQDMDALGKHSLCTCCLVSSTCGRLLSVHDVPGDQLCPQYINGRSAKSNGREHYSVVSTVQS